MLFLSLNSGVNPAAYAKRFWEAQKHTWTAVVDPDGHEGDLAEAIGVRLFPVNVVVGPDGVVQAIAQGWTDEIAARLRNAPRLD